jgi:hypothetical protein
MSPSSETDKLWDEEIAARLEEFRQGRATAIPYEQVQAEMNRRFGR